MKLLYGTGNPAKLAYMERRLRSLPIELLSLSDMLSPPPLIEEAGSDALQNARIKAHAYYEAYHIPVFSCDSGLYFDEVPEELQPGIYVRRIGGKTLTDEEMTAYYAALAMRFGVIPKVFQGNSAAPRGLTAQYRNAICLVMDSTHIYERMDESTAGRKFLLTDTPHPKREKGFPLDSLSVDLQSRRYYYDIADHATDEIASGDNRMSQAYARFFSEALEAFHRETEK
jgi:Ham1 family protein